MRQNQDETFEVEDLSVYEVTSPEEAIRIYAQGIKNKIVSSHKLNHASSRSHVIFNFQVHKSVGSEENAPPRVSRLMLVDLAGSERLSYLDGNMTREDKTMQKETIGINKSLMTLRKVINALIMKQNPRNISKETYYVPYRESKLTALLKQSLGGNAYCLFIACLSPSDDNYDENLSTL